MLKGSIRKEIPFIKKTAMGVLRNTFTSKDTALFQIKNEIINYYKTGYTDFFAAHGAMISESVESIQHAFSQNTFPGMKVTYDVYPEHIGHLETEGCFRCHNDAFTSGNGKKISRDCNLCHTIMGQGKPDNMQYSTIRGTLEFHHPVDIGTAWKEANCSECHRYLY
jgi:hypothetical protein